MLVLFVLSVCATGTDTAPGRSCHTLLAESSGNGGAVAISTRSDPQPQRVCVSPADYWTYAYALTVDIAHVVLEHNMVTSETYGGGGICVQVGGLVRITNAVVVNNTAGYGGGVMLGGLSSTEQSTCALSLSGGSLLQGNMAHHRGAQLYSTCSGDVMVEDVTVGMAISGSQV